MRCRRQSIVASLAVGAAAVVLTAVGCATDEAADVSSTDTTSSTVARVDPSTSTAVAPPVSPSALVMGAAARQLVTVDHTFGEGSRPFTIFLVQDHTDATAGAVGSDPSGGLAASRALTADERSEIERRLTPLGEVRWISNPSEYQDETLNPTVPGSAILGLGEATVEADVALLPVSLWCGGLCGTWFTYRLERAPDGAWQVAGKEGPIAIS